MEKIKDLIYDYSDVFFALIITAAMVGVVYINLTTIFDGSIAAIPDSSDILIGGSEPAASQDESNEIIIDLGDTAVGENTELEDSRHEPEADSPPVVEEPATPTPPPVSGEMVSVTIPNGTPGIGIARILVEHQLLPDTTAFVQAAEELELAVKLKSGTFQIPAGSSPEQMVRIIAGQ